MRNTESISVVDLFAGCGGMSLGFEEAGFSVLAAFENWEPAIDVYKANFNHPILKQDLSRVGESVDKISEFSPKIIIGGPPCQDFSTAGHQDETRGRAALSVSFSEIVNAVKPKYFVMENVATIRTSQAFKDVVARFKEGGYGLTIQVLNAALCGVPQNRKRMFVIGGLGENDGFLEELLLKNQADTAMTVHDYLGDSLGIEHYFRVPTNYNRRAVYSVHEPSMTIRAVDRPIPSGYRGHPRDSAPVSTVRGLTPKERSLIQTFPPEFKFTGTKTSVNMMIGNAVPVNLAKFVGDALMSHIRASVKERD